MSWYVSNLDAWFYSGYSSSSGYMSRSSRSSGGRGKGRSAMTSPTSSGSSQDNKYRYYNVLDDKLEESDPKGVALVPREVGVGDEEVGDEEVESVECISDISSSPSASQPQTPKPPKPLPKGQENPWPYLETLFKFFPSKDASCDQLSFECVLCNTKPPKLLRAHKSSKSNLKTHLRLVHQNEKPKWAHLMSLRGKTDPIASTPKTGATSRHQSEEDKKREAEEVKKFMERGEGMADSGTGDRCNVTRNSKTTKLQHQLSLVYAHNRVRAEPEKVNRKITNFIVGEMLPFRTVEKDTFREMLTSLNPECEILGRKAFVSHLKTVFGKKKNALIRIFQDVPWVATTADLWSAHNK